MPVVQLSAQFVRNAACPQGKAKVDYYDSSIKGFILEARASGGRTFHLRYRDSHGKLAEWKASYPGLTTPASLRTQLEESSISAHSSARFVARCWRVE